MRGLWISRGGDDKPLREPNTHAAFRGRFSLAAESPVEVRAFGSNFYRAWLDGREINEGPPRFRPAAPEYDSITLKLGAGEHVLAVHATYRGLGWHRVLLDLDPFIAFVVLVDGKPVDITWRAAELGGIIPPTVQVNPLLGWAERIDTRQLPEDWELADFDDASWAEPIAVDVDIPEPDPATAGPVLALDIEPEELTCGVFAERYGHQGDELPWRFFTRDLDAAEHPAQGAWWRYDLGRVRLGRPFVVLDVPQGAIVEVCLSEFLVEGRVTPYVLGGKACNMDSWIARGGMQVFSPFEPRGGRYMEVHVFVPDQSEDPAEAAVMLSARFVERAAYEEPDASWESSDESLNDVWATGIETFRACTEDAPTDNPTRERGQWTGDVVNVGLDIAAVGYHDVRLLRRALVQAAQSARQDGLVAAMSTGFSIYIASFAAQWTRACLRFRELTGDDAILPELFDAAERNGHGFLASTSADGVDEDICWNFVDWGYQRPEGKTDVVLNLFVADAFQALAEWSAILGREDRAAFWSDKARDLRAVAEGQLASFAGDWDAIGYHAAALALRYGYVPDGQAAGCIDFIKAHLLRCFPNNPHGPRHYSPEMLERRIITPYFAHFVLPALIERGEMAFVMDQYRTCWGWMLDEGLTTWAEVFDLRWSHAHQWSGCPTWQLSRYTLGLHPAFDRGAGHFDVRLAPGDLEWVEGTIPVPGTEQVITTGWTRKGRSLLWTVRTPVPLVLDFGDGTGPVRVEDEVSMKLAIRDGFAVRR